jgi:hypothetical protein
MKCIKINAIIHNPASLCTNTVNKQNTSNGRKYKIGVTREQMALE